MQCVPQAQQLFQQLGNLRGMIDARLMFCDLAGLAGKNANLEAQAKEALRLAEQMSFTARIAMAKGVLGSISYDTDIPEASLQYHLLNVALWHELESPFELAKALINPGVDLLEIVNTRQPNKPSSNAGTFTDRWATSVESPQPYITIEESLK